MNKFNILARHRHQAHSLKSVADRAESTSRTVWPRAMVQEFPAWEILSRPVNSSREVVIGFSWPPFV